MLEKRINDSAAEQSDIEEKIKNWKACKSA
jgi:hypothetical protein